MSAMKMMYKVANA